MNLLHVLVIFAYGFVAGLFVGSCSAARADSASASCTQVLEANVQPAAENRTSDSGQPTDPIGTIPLRATITIEQLPDGGALELTTVVPESV